MTHVMRATVLICAITAAGSAGVAGETGSVRMALDYFERQFPEWSGHVHGQADPVSNDLFRQCGLSLDVIRIENGGTTRMPDGTVIVEASDHRFLWRVAVSPENGRTWRVQGFDRSDLVDLIRSRTEHHPDDNTAVRLLTTAFSGRRLFARLVLTRADVAAVVRDLTITCGKAPRYDEVMNALPSALPSDISRRGLVISSTCTDVVVEWWYFRNDSSGVLVIGKTKRVSSLPY